MITIKGGGSFSRQNIDDINSNFQQLSITPGRVLYVYPATSATGTQTGTEDHPYTTLPTAYSAASAGKNDVIALVGNGAAGGSARLSSGLTWAKDATHLIGIDSGVNVSNRARIAPPSGATAFANFFTVSGNGCRFSNVQWFHGFGTGVAAAICLTVTGGRNYFDSCHIAGMGDDASAQDAASRSLKITTTGENMFVDCTIGLDTVTRTVANASLEFASGAPRNKFIRCEFPFMTSSATTLGIIVSAAAGSDRNQLFTDCDFINSIKSTSTVMTALSTLAASIGGLHLFRRCVLVGITDYGSDATTLAQQYVDGLTGAAATSGIAVNPS